MKALIQRVTQAKVTVADRVVGEIGRGLLIFLGLGKGDDDKNLTALAQKIATLRIFQDAAHEKKFHLSLLDVGGAALVVSQFTLYADTSKGRRPEFFGALEPAPAEALYQQFMEALRAAGVTRVEAGEFGAYMQVSLENDGPVTLMVEM
jgi:D-aminoacyl-tRNA deacylase